MAVGDVMTVRVVSVRPEEPAARAVRRMLEERIGSVVVCDGPRLVGIFTERDVLRLAGEGADLGATPVSEVMTRRLVTVDPDVGVVDAARLMCDRDIRHLPVVEDGNLLGILGIRDVVACLVDRVGEGDEASRAAARELFRRA